MASPTREQILRDVIALALHLIDDPDAKQLPVDDMTFRISHCVGVGVTDEEGMAELGRIARVLGVEVISDNSTHFHARKSFGTATYEAYYITRRHMSEYEAFMATRPAWKAARAAADIAPQVAGPAVAAVGPATTPEDGHVYACCGKVGRISRHERWCPLGISTDTPPSSPEAPATTPAPEFELGKAGEHYMASGTKGDEPGDCGAECKCGAGFYGFDTLGEAVEHLDRHIANPDPGDTETPFHRAMRLEGVDPDFDEPAPADDVSIAVTGAEDGPRGPVAGHYKLAPRPLFPQDAYDPHCACGAEWPCHKAFPYEPDATEPIPAPAEGA